MARQQDGTALGRRSRASAVFEAKPRLAQLPVAQFPALPPDGCILRPRVGVYGAGIEPRRADGCVEITFVSARFVCFEQCLGTLHGGEVVDETGVAADTQEPSPIYGVFDIPVGAAECCVEIFPFAQDTVGDQQPVKRGAQVLEVGEERLAREFVVGHVETAVRMLEREQQIGTFAQFLAQQRVLRLEEQDVADVDQRVIGDADRFDVVAPLLDERSLFRKVVLSERCAAVAVAVSALLHEFEVADIGQAAVPEQAVAGHRREHPHRTGVGVLHGVFLRADDTAQIGLCSDFDPFAVFRAPERERVVADIAADRFEPVGERDSGTSQGEFLFQPVDVVNGVFENLVPVGAAQRVTKCKTGLAACFEP